MSRRKPDKSAFFRSTGRTLIPAETKAEELLSEMGKDALLRVTLTKPRRHKFHRYYFATIGNYFDNWPETHSFQPDNEHHLRAWAQVKAGYRDLLGERLDHNEGDVHAMSNFITRCLARQREHGYGFVTIHNGSLVFATPKSVAYDALDEAAFRPIAEKVFAVLEQETGLPLSDMYVNPE